MRSIAIASLLVLAGTAAQAEIVCTTHRGCFETGGRIILGNGGGVNRQESTISHREAKPKKIIFAGTTTRASSALTTPSA